MIKLVLFDFSRVLLFPRDTSYTGTLNGLNRELRAKNENYNALDYFVLNKELLDYCRNLKDKYDIAIFTSDEIQNEPPLLKEISPVFENILSAKDYGLKKTDRNSYMAIAEKLDKPPEEILYVDDNAGNIEAAKAAGLKTVLYKDNPTLFSGLTVDLA